MASDRFLLSALVDFPDDCGHIVFTPELLAQLIDQLKWMGVSRVYWNYYQKGMWAAFADILPATAPTLEKLGEPMDLALRMAHERGMEFYATIKPYETGMSHTSPKASPEMRAAPGLPGIGGLYRVDPWVMAHPDMRVRSRTADIPAGLEKIPVERVQLRQKDMSPVRIKPENLEIWTSSDNNGYQKRDVAFTLSESVEISPRDIFELGAQPSGIASKDVVLTRKGDPVRALNLSGLHLLDPFIAVTTNFDDQQGGFSNTATEMVRAFGPGDQPLPIVVASHKSLWRRPRDLRTGDLEYDGGIGDLEVFLDVTNERPIFSNNTADQATAVSDSRDGVIAFAKGRNRYVPGSLCEAYPQVQEYWLSWVGECIMAGVDGVDFRIASHSCWTNTPDMYGFNEPVLVEYQRRYGVNPDLDPYDPKLLGALRGEFFDQFLDEAKARLAAAGKSMQVHAEVESFRPDAVQGRWRTRPGDISFNWRNWLRSGLADEVTIFGRGWMPDRILNDALTQDVLQEAAAAGIPAHLNKHVGHSRDGQVHGDLLEYIYRFGGLSGYTLYETSAMFDREHLDPDGRLQFNPGFCEGIRRRAETLGII